MLHLILRDLTNTVIRSQRPTTFLARRNSSSPYLGGNLRSFSPRKEREPFQSPDAKNARSAFLTISANNLQTLANDRDGGVDPIVGVYAKSPGSSEFDMCYGSTEHLINTPAPNFQKTIKISVFFYIYYIFKLYAGCVTFLLICSASRG